MKKRAKSASTNIESCDPEIVVHITYPLRETDIKVSACARYAETGILVEKIRTQTMTAKTRKDITNVQNYLVERINIEIKKVNNKSKGKKCNEQRDQLDANNLMVSVFNDVVDSGIQIGKWRTGDDSTQSKALAYFRNNILPIIMNCESADDFTEVDNATLFEALVGKALDNKNSIGDPRRADAKARNHFFEARLIYSYMRDLNSSLPNLVLLDYGRAEAIKREQVKYCPIEVHREYELRVIDLIHKDPRMARAAAIYDSGGLRSAESAAVTAVDIIDMGDFIVLVVQTQEKGGRRCPYLKREASYRMVVLDDFGTYVVRECNKLIGPETDDGIAPVETAKLCAWVKQALLDSGYTNEMLHAAFADMKYHPERDNKGKVIPEVTSYILRRLRMTIAYSILGYSKEDIDYTFAHVNKMSPQKRRSYKTPEKQRILYEKTKRYCILPEISRNPRYCPVELYPGYTGDINPFNICEFKNTSNKRIKVKLSCTGSVVGESITLYSNGTIVSSTPASCSMPDCPSNDIIGIIPDQKKA